MYTSNIGIKETFRSMVVMVVSAQPHGTDIEPSHSFERLLDRATKNLREFNLSAAQLAATRLWRQKHTVCYVRGRNPSIGKAFLSHSYATKAPLNALSRTQRAHNKRRAWCRAFARRTRPT